MEMFMYERNKANGMKGTSLNPDIVNTLESDAVLVSSSS